MYYYIYINILTRRVVGVNSFLQLEFHIHHAKEAAKIVKILSLLDSKTGKVTKNSPRCLLAKQNAIVEVGILSSCRSLSFLLGRMCVIYSRFCAGGFARSRMRGGVQSLQSFG